MAVINGTSGDDVIPGTAAADQIFGKSGDDRLEGLGGDDRLEGGAGDDRLFGAAGDDLLLGLGSADRLFGDTGEDRLLGGGGDDRLFGGADDDQLHGGGGDDWLEGGEDHQVAVIAYAGGVLTAFGVGDELWGGGGRNTIRFDGDGDGQDVVHDFARGKDRLEVSDVVLADVAQVVIVGGPLGAGLLITTGTNDGLFLKGLTAPLTLGTDLFLV